MKRIVAIVAIGALIGALQVESALAAKAGTNLTMNIADTSVGTNDTIHVRGKLKSRRARCKRNKTIELYIRGGLAGTTTTEADGSYHFPVRGPHPTGTHKFQTRFQGTQRCRASRGPSVNVTVS